MAPKRCRTYLEPGPRRGRRRVTQDTDVPSPEAEQPVPKQTTFQGIRDSGTMTVESRYLKDYQRQNPPSFKGGKIDPVAAKNWLEAMETAFFYMNCLLEYQVHCGTYMLKGETHFLWKGAKKMIAPHGESIS